MFFFLNPPHLLLPVQLCIVRNCGRWGWSHFRLLVPTLQFSIFFTKIDAEFLEIVVRRWDIVENSEKFTNYLFFSTENFDPYIFHPFLFFPVLYFRKEGWDYGKSKLKLLLVFHQFLPFVFFLLPQWKWNRSWRWFIFSWDVEQGRGGLAFVQILKRKMYIFSFKEVQ